MVSSCSERSGCDPRKLVLRLAFEVAAVTATLLLLGVGISTATAEPAKETPAVRKPASGKTEAADSDDKAGKKVELKIATWKETEELIASHKGKVVVLDAWSTSCAPCVKEFPNLVKLHEKLAADVACISFSTDYAGIKKKPPEFYQERVLAFLKKQNATFDNILCSQASDDVYQELGIASIPAVFVYGRDGKLVKRFDNESLKPGEEEFTYADVNKLVDELLSAK